MCRGCELLGLVLVVVVGAAIVVSELAGRRVGVAAPVLLLASGILAGFIPALRQVQLPPQMVLLLFLPALLYWESLNTSPRDMRVNLRGITLTGTVLVVVTATAVAAAAHALGLGWGPAWVLGAAVAPTDATATAMLAGRLPRRMITVLQAESLINDGTALVIYAVAVGVTVRGEQLSIPHAGWMLLVAYGGGALAGAVTARIALPVRRRLDDPLLHNVVMLLIPFTAFLLAEATGASGVLAVVVCGLIMSQAGPRAARPPVRLIAVPFWSLSTFVLNAALFVLVGLQAQSAVRGIPGAGVARALATVAVVSAVLVFVRFAFLFTATYLIRLLDRRPQQRLLRTSDRARVVSGLTGFRGAVSLAVALSVPQTLASGSPFPGRDVIIFVTFGVIVVTISAQGLLLPHVIRWARLPPDTSVEAEQHLAETLAAEDALAALPRLATQSGTDPEVSAQLRREYIKRLRVLHAADSGDADEAALQYDQQDTALRLALLARKRATVLRLRDERRIDDTVLRRIQARLDIEEARLTRREAAE